MVALTASLIPVLHSICITVIKNNSLDKKEKPPRTVYNTARIQSDVHSINQEKDQESSVRNEEEPLLHYGGRDQTEEDEKRMDKENDRRNLTKAHEEYKNESDISLGNMIFGKVTNRSQDHGVGISKLEAKTKKRQQLQADNQNILSEEEKIVSNGDNCEVTIIPVDEKSIDEIYSVPEE